MSSSPRRSLEIGIILYLPVTHALLCVCAASVRTVAQRHVYRSHMEVIIHTGPPGSWLLNKTTSHGVLSTGKQETSTEPYSKALLETAPNVIPVGVFTHERRLISLLIVTPQFSYSVYLVLYSLKRNGQYASIKPAQRKREMGHK